MIVVLTLRQLKIIKDLPSTNKPITAKALFNKYSVSQRSIRYDLEKIEEL